MVIAGGRSDLCGDGELSITIPQGLVGFGDATRFVLAKDKGNPDFHWLRSLDSPRLAFLLVSPHLVFADYEVELSDADALAMGANRPEDLALLTIVTPGDEGQTVTVNLLAPIIVNVNTLAALQSVPQDGGYSEKHPLPGVRVGEYQPARLVA